MRKNDFFHFKFFFISLVFTQLPRTPNHFPLPRHWTRDRDFGPATATLDPRARLWTRDPRLLVKLYPGHWRHMRTRLWFCFAATLHGSSHSTGIPAETTYDVCCRRCMYIPGMFLYVGTVSHAVQATVIESRTGVIFWFSGQTNCEARGTFPRRACMSDSSRSLCPFPFACLKNAKK